MKFANIREASRNFSTITHLIDDGDDVVLTRNGKPYLLIKKLDEDDLEDYILAKHARVEEIAKKPGKTYGLKEVKKQLGL